MCRRRRLVVEEEMEEKGVRRYEESVKDVEMEGMGCRGGDGRRRR